jgi:hypothetical protein
MSALSSFSHIEVDSIHLCGELAAASALSLPSQVGQILHTLLVCGEIVEPGVLRAIMNLPSLQLYWLGGQHSGHLRLFIEACTGKQGKLGIQCGAVAEEDGSRVAVGRSSDGVLPAPLLVWKLRLIRFPFK